MEIDPCKACIKKYERTGCDINDLNNCCYETLSAFSGKDSINSLTNDTNLLNCRECIASKLATMGPFPDGYTVCDHRIAPPPIFVQTPHYFPQVFDGKDIEGAKQQCISMCSNTSYPNECIENCLTDADAVVIKEKYDDCQCGGNSLSQQCEGDYYMAIIIQFILLCVIISVGYKLYIIFKTKME